MISNAKVRSTLADDLVRLLGDRHQLSRSADAFGGRAPSSRSATPVTGWVLDHYSYAPVFIGFGLLPLRCATILWLLVGELRPIDMRTTIRGIYLQEAAIPN